MRGRVAAAIASLLVAAAVAGCGDGEEKRSEYRRDAARACAAVAGALTPSRRPRDYYVLKRYTGASEQALSKGLDRLRELRSTLGDDADDEIAAFDERLDPAVDATRKLNVELIPAYGDATRGVARSIIVEARRTRAAFDGLYRAARVADLDQCGRGGNRLVDNVLGVVYSDQRAAADRALIRTVDRFPGGLSPRTRQARQLRATSAYLRRVQRLEPPSDVRALHKRVVKTLAKQVHINQRLLDLFATPGDRAVSEARRLFARSDRLTDRQVALSGRIIRILDR